MSDTQTRAVIVQLQPAALRRDAAAQYVGISMTKFEQLVSDGRMPAPFTIDRVTLWRRAELDAALEDFVSESAPSVWDEDGDSAA